LGFVSEERVVPLWEQTFFLVSMRLDGDEYG